MRVDDIEEDGYAHAVGSIDKLFQFVRCPVPRAGSEEVVDLVPKSLKSSSVKASIQHKAANKLTGIIGVLHDCHELDSIISQSLDPWKDVRGKLLISTDSAFRCGYTNMGFVDSDTRRLWRRLMLENVDRLGRRVPETCVIHGRDG